MLWRQVRAKLLARRGEHAEAERLGREAVAICDDTEMLDQQGDAYADLVEVLQLGGKTDEAAAALEQALDRYERKGNVVMAETHEDAARRASGCSRSRLTQARRSAGRYATYSSAIASASSRIAIPSSTSSRVIVSGGTTMITFQWVIR